MGLDTVELVLAFEEEFEIAFPDKDAETLTTPGQVADYVLSRLQSNPDGPCQSQVRFYRLRAALMQVFGLPRNAIRPQTPLREILRGRLRQQWAQLRQIDATTRLPRLERAPLFLLAAAAGIPAVASISLFYAGLPFSASLWGFLLLSGLVNVATLNLGTRLPAHLQTVEDMIPYVFCGKPVRWDREIVLARVIQITAGQLGLRVEEVREDAHFVRDLGAD